MAAMGMSWLRWGAGAALGALAMGCGAAAFGADDAGGSELDADDWASEWRQLALPVPQFSEQAIARTPDGWLLVSSAYVYRSSDGVRWTRVHLPNDEGRLTGVAYGGGRYVIVGRSSNTGYLIWVSADGETWQAPPVTEGIGIDGVQFVEDRFIAWGAHIWSSQDAESWVQQRREDFYTGAGAAFGAGRYLLVGTGTPQISQDGLSWSSAPIDCSLPTACVVDVDEGNPYHRFQNVVFAEGHFHVARLRSPDGQNWEESTGPSTGLGPTSYLSGRFVRRQRSISDAGTLEAWSEGGTPQQINFRPPPEFGLPSEDDIPESLDYSWSDGLDCTSARCVLVGKELYLIP